MEGGAVLTQAIGHVQQWRRKALAHQCRSCNHLWALHLVYGSGGQLILCRYRTPQQTLSARPTYDDPYGAASRSTVRRDWFTPCW